MRSIKFMIFGAFLILLGPILSLVDFFFHDICILCWIIGIPVLVIGMWMPTETSAEPPKPSDGLPQRVCPECGKSHDFDYPKCPHCGHDYQSKQVK